MGLEGQRDRLMAKGDKYLFCLLSETETETASPWCRRSEEMIILNANRPGSGDVCHEVRTGSVPVCPWSILYVAQCKKKRRSKNEHQKKIVPSGNKRKKNNNK